MALLTPAQWRTHYPQLNPASTDEDVPLASLIAEADDLIASFCGYPETDAGGHTMASATYTLFASGPSPIERSALCVCVHPIVSITSLHVDVTRVYGAGTLLVLNTDYTFDSREGLVVLATTSATPMFPSGFRAIKIVVVAGYAVIPPGLRMIAVAAVRHLWDLRNVQGQTGHSYGGDSASLADADSLLPQAVKDALSVGGYLTPCAAARQAA